LLGWGSWLGRMMRLCLEAWDGGGCLVGWGRCRLR